LLIGSQSSEVYRSADWLSYRLQQPMTVDKSFLPFGHDYQILPMALMRDYFFKCKQYLLQISFVIIYFRNHL